MIFLTTWYTKVEESFLKESDFYYEEQEGLKVFALFI